MIVLGLSTLTQLCHKNAYSVNIIYKPIATQFNLNQEKQLKKCIDS